MHWTKQLHQLENTTDLGVSDFSAAHEMAW